MSDVEAKVAPARSAGSLMEHTVADLGRMVAVQSFHEGGRTKFYTSLVPRAFVRDGSDRVRARVLKFQAPVVLVAAAAGAVVVFTPALRGHVWLQVLAVVLALGPYTAMGLMHAWLERGLWRPKLAVSTDLATAFVRAAKGADASKRAWFDQARVELFAVLSVLEEVVATPRTTVGGVVDHAAEQQLEQRAAALLEEAVAVTATAVTSRKRA